MALLIGVDEAGYGPNLGPLVVAATAWKVEGEKWKGERRKGKEASLYAVPDLYAYLRRAVSREPDGKRVAIADSKALYKPAIGLAHLEHGVLCTLRVAGVVGASRSPQQVALGAPRSADPRHPRSSQHDVSTEPPPLALPRMGEGDQWRWSSLVETLAADVELRQRELPWHEEFDCDVPCACDHDGVHSASERLNGAMNTAGVQLRSIRARLVFPREFNELCEQYGNKAAALSEVTMRLVREVVDSEQETGDRKQKTVLPSSLSPVPCPLSTFILCDKHGGRNHYAALVQQHFPESWVETLHESRAESWYRTTGDLPLDFCFRMNGETFLPAALASMTAKYVRELSMRAFNEYWCGRIKDLRPTAGYPVDAKRFRLDIAREQRRLGIADRLLWRER